MDQKKIEEYKKELEAAKTKLLEELKKDEAPTDFGSDVDSFEEEAQEAGEFSEKMALGQTHKEQINNIDAALGKISSGKFGVCEKCGGEIEEKVLRITPESKLCKSCKKKEG